MSRASLPVWANATALGFDLGETLITYRDTPLSWADLYGVALRVVATKVKRELHDEAVQLAGEILTRYNTRINPRTAEMSADVIFGEILAAWNWPETMREEVIEAFFGFFQQRLVAYPETLQVLHALKHRGMRIGVLTDVPYGMPRHLVERDLAETGLGDFVDVLLTSVDVGHRKPAPDGFRTLARALEVPIGELIYVGNEPKDIEGPKTAGARAVLVSREHATCLLGQDATISSLSALLGQE